MYGLPPKKPADAITKGLSLRKSFAIRRGVCCSLIIAACPDYAITTFQIRFSGILATIAQHQVVQPRIADETLGCQNIAPY